MKISKLTIVAIICTLISCSKPQSSQEPIYTGNPILKGWYADPEAIIIGEEYWIYPTYSDAFEKQVFMDAFHSKDFVTWNKAENIIDTSIITWARQALWAPCMVPKDDKYFLFFAANDVQTPDRKWWDPDNDINHFGGIGIAVADEPGGPFKDYLGKPLIAEFYNNAQPIDQFVFQDKDGSYYIIYGGWGRCNIGRLNEDFTALEPWSDSTMVHEITPKGYVEGPFIFTRNDKYYFMWSEGDWANDTYHVVYGISDNLIGPYERQGVILSSDTTLATGAGHNSVLNIPGTDDWYMVYHRRPIPNLGRDHRVTCIDRMTFDDEGRIITIKMTKEGVAKRTLP